MPRWPRGFQNELPWPAVWRCRSHGHAEPPHDRTAPEHDHQASLNPRGLLVARAAASSDPSSIRFPSVGIRGRVNRRESRARTGSSTTAVSAGPSNPRLFTSLSSSLPGESGSTPPLQRLETRLCWVLAGASRGTDRAAPSAIAWYARLKAVGGPRRPSRSGRSCLGVLGKGETHRR